MPADALQNIKTYEGWASDFYEPLAIRHYDQAIARMLRCLRPRLNGEILDAGCGTGVHSVRVAKTGLLVRAVDISPVALDEARCRAADSGLSDRVHFERADLNALPFPDHSFDAIFSWGVVIHINPMEKSLSELLRVLKPGGRLALQVTNSTAFDYAIERLARGLFRKPKKNQERTRFGIGAWDDGSSGRLWTVQAKVREITRFMEQLGGRRTHRFASEFTELQRHTRGLPRTALRLVNHLWFALRLPAFPACTNVLEFEKRA